MSEPSTCSPLSTSGTASRRRNLALAVAVALAAVALGAAAAGLASRQAAFAFAAWLDLGRNADRTVFAAAMSGMGAVAGAALGLWCGLPGASGPAICARLVAAAVGAVALLATALGYGAFAVTTPPPPVQPALVVQLRLDGLGWGGVTVTGETARAAIRAESVDWRVDDNDVTTADATLPMGEPGGMRSVVLTRAGEEIARFSLDFPGDPPATQRYSHWLTPDRRAGTVRGIEMRFRIERRVLR